MNNLIEFILKLIEKHFLKIKALLSSTRVYAYIRVIVSKPLEMLTVSENVSKYKNYILSIII
jgi:hypothetical protein